ncbi:hypothetical protein SDC9_203142 [bioreactor metagenome]|uniref:Uncharacterized protein n=1 Tax=bioreactor metagenome TaxID=1076179 RepID=A0A645IX37_9ZZZZ
MNVFEAAGLIIDQVFAAAAAHGAAGDADFRQGERQIAVGIIENDADLSHAESAALFGAGKNHILQLAASQCFGALLTQHPTQSISYI